MNIASTDRSSFFARPIAWMVFLLLMLSNPAWADSPSLVDINVNTGGRYVTLDARLINGLNGKVREAIDSGVPITFTYTSLHIN